MKAGVIRGFGGLDVVRLEDVDEPRPGRGEVLLDVRAAALNHLDIWVRQGRPGAELPMPHVLGSDAAGVVVGLGEGVREVEIGQEVMVYPGLWCGHCEFCLAGQQSLCARFGILGLSRWGTFAQRLVVPARNLQPKPAYLGFEQAAAMGVAYLTAWRMLTTCGHLLPGQTVLIHGIGGGVALAALQLAVQSGARVFVTSGSDEKLGRAKLLGASAGINYRQSDDLAGAVRDWTGGRGVDLAIDAVGAATWPVDIAAVRRGGRVVLCGVTTGPQAMTNLQAVYWNQLTLAGSTLCSMGEFGQFLRMLDTTKFEPVIDSTLPLERLRDGMGRMETGEQFGKIVLTIG